MTLESHPLLEQVQALQSFELQVMYVDGEHARHQAQRSKLLAAALARLEANPRDKIDDPARWKKTLGMLAEVATMQMAGNLSDINGQKFVLGRRVHHTDFGDGSHDESADNPVFGELANKLGTRYINRSCVECHQDNGRALPPAVGQALCHYVVRVGDSSGGPDPVLGAILQPQVTQGSAEGDVILSSWTEADGLRSPNYSFIGATPTHFGARIASPIVGIGLLEAIKESDIEALADPFDSDGDGMPDEFELAYGTQPNSADHNGDIDGDGYTNLENYLHWAARPR